MSETTAPGAAPPAPPLGDDDGFFGFAWRGGAVTVDLYRAHNRLIRIRETCGDLPEGEDATEAENQAIVAYMEALGFGAVSHKMALKFMVTVHTMVGDLRKNDSGATPPSAKPE